MPPRSSEVRRRGLDQMRFIADNLPVVVAYLDTGQRFQFANQRCVELLERPERATLGRSAAEVLGKKNYERIRSKIEEGLTGQQVTFETHLAFDGSGIRWMHINFVPDFRATRRTICGLFVLALDATERWQVENALRSARDELERRVAERTENLAKANEALVAEIAERRRAEAALREREAELRGILETAVDGIITLDEQGRIESFNHAAEQIFGYRADEVIAQNVNILMTEPFRSEHNAFFTSYRLNGEKRFLGTRREVWGRRKGGATFPMELGLGELQNDERKFVGVVRDVTDRKLLEEELRHSQKMEAVGALASGIAHDFNNVLMGILGCSDLALDELAPDSPARRYLEEMKKAAQSGSLVVQQLMAFGRSRALESKVVDVNEVVAATGTMLRHLLGEDVELQLKPGVSAAHVRCDPIQLEQILMNLAVNARHAMPMGGTFTLEVTELTVDDNHPLHGVCLKQGAYVMLRVADTGCGMDEQTRARVFEPFFTTKAPGQGTGLGLSTVYGIVERHQGYIDLKSEVGRGTTFTIYLPRSHEPLSRPPRPPRNATEPAGGQVVLVAEDESLVRRAVRHYLERCGFRVLEAPDGAEALRLCREHPEPIALLLTDMVLPKIGGRELELEARALRPGLHVLYMSARSPEMLEEEGRLQASIPMLQKPFTEDELLSKVMEALRYDLEEAPPSTVRAGSSPHRPPSSSPMQLALRLSDSHSHDAEGPLVLLVEDNDAARSVANELLRRFGYRVVAARNGAEARDLFREAPNGVDVVLTDVSLPDIPGQELVATLRRIRTELAVVYLSGMSQHDRDLAPALLEPRTCFIQKPAPADAIVGAIRRVLNTGLP